jgi:hypothetical protein
VQAIWKAGGCVASDALLGDTAEQRCADLALKKRHPDPGDSRQNQDTEHEFTEPAHPVSPRSLCGNIGGNMALSMPIYCTVGNCG